METGYLLDNPGNNLSFHPDALKGGEGVKNAFLGNFLTGVFNDQVFC
jgi:hypothetical protein